MRRVFIMVALLGVAFALRLYRLDAVPLRGDEAFAVRYWAAPPLTVLRDLADWEPHPFGTSSAWTQRIASPASRPAFPPAV